MKKIVIILIFIVTPIIAFAQQQNTPYVEVKSNVEFHAKAEKYIAKVEISKNLIYNNFRNEVTFAEIKENYFKKLKDADFNIHKFNESTMQYLTYNQDKKGTILIFETSSEKEFKNLLSIKSEGVNIMYRDIVYKLSDQQQEEILKDAIENAKHKAEIIALKSNRKIGKIIMVLDHNSNIIKEALYYLNADGIKRYQITVRFELL